MHLVGYLYEVGVFSVTIERKSNRGNVELLQAFVTLCVRL
jgi:hypothetical protein